MTNKRQKNQASTPTSEDGEQKYTASEWNIAASDDKGHYVKQVYNVQPAIGRQVGLVVESKRFPYKSVSDLIRHAIYRHLHWLSTLEEDVVTFLGQIEVINRLVEEHKAAVAFEDSLRKTGQQISMYVGRGDREQAANLVIDLKRLLKSIPDGYWKRQYIKELDDKWGGFITEVVENNKVDFTLLED